MNIKLDPFLCTKKYEGLNYIQCVAKLAELSNDVYEDMISQKESTNTLFEIASLMKYMLALCPHLECKNEGKHSEIV